MFVRLRLPTAALAFVSLTPSLSMSASATSPTLGSAKHRAQATYERGVAAYRDGRFRAAIEHFIAADGLAPSPALSYNVARAYERLDEAARALAHYRDYLRRAAEPSNAHEVKQRIRQLEAELVEQGVQQFTILSAPQGARVYVSGAQRGTTPWTGELPFGAHELRVVLEGYAPKHVQLEAQAEAARDLVLNLDPLLQVNATLAGASKRDSSAMNIGRGAVHARPALTERAQRPADESSWQPWPWVTVGAGGLTLAGAGLFELLRRDAESDAREAHTQPKYHEQRERMERHQTTARVLTGVGTTLVVGGGVLFLVDAVTRERIEAPVTVGCGGAGCLGVWTGSF